MSALGLGIARLYFDFRPVAWHQSGCPRGADEWEVTGYDRPGWDGHADSGALTFRFACQTCGAVRFVKATVLETETSDASQIGYGSRPEKAAGLWLHPGPRLWRGDDSPQAWYATTSPDRPRQASDVAGLVARDLGPRGGIRWSAGLGATDYGTARTGSGQTFGSRRAAVAWIAAQLTGGAR